MRPDAATPFVLHAGEHICIIGNQLAERMQYEGWLDTLLHARFPRHDLVIRNLGFSGDEVATRLRSKNFGTPDEWLSGVGEEIGGYKENRLKSTNTKADVIFAFFGYNESYGGDAGLPAFRKQLDEWITHTLAQKYNGKTAPRIVLFSPIAHEDLRNPDLPDGKENNARLEMYTLAMSQVAAARGVRFVDLFAPTRSLYATAKTPLTINGVHLNEEGNRRVAEIIDRELFGAPPRTYARDLPVGAAARRRRQELPVVQALPHHRRLRHLRRSRLPDLHQGQPAQRQPDAREVRQGRRAADQLRGARARGRGARPHDRATAIGRSGASRAASDRARPR